MSVSCADPADKFYYLWQKFEEICCWSIGRFGARGKNQLRDQSHLQGRESCVPGMCRCRQETSDKLQEEPDGRQQEWIKQLCLSVFLSHRQNESLSLESECSLVET